MSDRGWFWAVMAIITVVFFGVAWAVTTVWPNTYTKIEGSCVVEYEAKGFRDPVAVGRVCP